ncbi:UNVERIFIED_CONTAM: hypothetical protein Sradi_6563300 [Sesamum radiatum]|uniref:Uncharacterized protein n=1 Tax=Sesamum radiatum TaxID=300843 RepID=A0AAW2JZ94_SESRA
MEDQLVPLLTWTERPECPEDGVAIIMEEVLVPVPILLSASAGRGVAPRGRRGRGRAPHRGGGACKRDRLVSVLELCGVN